MVMIKKIKGNTLPEILIAIVILTFSSAIGVTIYINIQQSSQPFIKLKAQELAYKYLIDLKQEKKWLDKSFNEEEFIIKRIIKPSEIYPDCIFVEIRVSDLHEKKICELNQLIYAP